MITYLIKSILCLLVLLLIHRLILQREVLHRFNRFFLLGAVIGSFLIPLITVEVQDEMRIEPIPDFVQSWEKSGEEESIASVSAIQVPEITRLQLEKSESPFPWLGLAVGMYGLVTLLYFICFVRNLIFIRNQILTHPHKIYHGENLVLLSANTSPFSFLRYIFVSKSDFERNGISEAVFLHEQCHVREKHTWDILLLEAMLVPFWFHPGLHWAKQTIRLNHEFIADQAALDTIPVQQYQQELLTYLIGNPTFPLTSSLNFSLTKKRFQIMKRKSTNRAKWSKVLFVLPVFGAMIYIFSEKVTAKAELASDDTQPILGNRDSRESEAVYTLVNTPIFKGMPLEAYLARYVEFQTKANENRLFSQPSKEQVEALRKDYDALLASYYKLSMEERRRVKRADFPYAKIEKNGLVAYKKWENLTEEERKNLGC